MTIQKYKIICLINKENQKDIDYYKKVFGDSLKLQTISSYYSGKRIEVDQRQLLEEEATFRQCQNLIRKYQYLLKPNDEIYLYRNRVDKVGNTKISEAVFTYKINENNKAERFNFFQGSRD